MNIAVCVKQIPDTALPFSLDPHDYTLVREGALIMDESDSYGVELALQLVAADGGGEVALVSMVPGASTSGLRGGLAVGAARALVISDPQLAGSDSLGTAKVLAAAVGRLAPDLVLAGTESTDGYTGMVPVQIAELLGWPSVSYARHVELCGGILSIERQSEAGYDDVICPLPAVVTLTAGVVEPRYPTFKGIRAAQSKPIEELSVSGLGLDPRQVGFAGARQQVICAQPVPMRPPGEIVTDTGEAYKCVIAFLERLKVL